MIKSRTLVKSSNFVRTSVELKPMKHQLVSLKHAEQNPVVYDASDAGTGKTGVRIWAFAKRRAKRGGRLLVLAPRTLLKTAWGNDFKKFAPHLKVSIATAANREAAFNADADAYISNHDSVKWLKKQRQAWWTKMGFSELVIDEPTAFKHYTSQRSRAMFGIRKNFKFRAGLSATPNPNGICDIWHQILLLDDGKRLGDTYFGFRASVCTPVGKGKDKAVTEWVDKEGAEEAVFGLLSDIVIRHKIEECTDIPPTHHYQVEYDMPDAQRKAYNTMEMSQLLLLIPAMVTNTLLGGVPKHAPGLVPGVPTPTVRAINAAAVTTKLLQICSGAVYDEDGTAHLVDTGRYEMILDMIEARKHSLVFFQWKHQKEQLTQLAEARGITFCTMDGSASDDERSAMVTAYQAGAYRVMFAHPKSAAHGLTLTKGTSTIWCGPIYDLELFQQGNKRQARIGQKEKTEVVMVLAKDTIEESVYELLMGKNTRMKTLLDLFESLYEKAKTA